MSNADYVRMRTPKKGLKTIDAVDIEQEDPTLYDPESWKNVKWRDMNVPGGIWQAFLWAPFNDPKAPGVWSVVGVAVLVFVGCLVNGWVVKAAYIHALAVSGDAFLRSILMAVVSGSIFYVTQLWTHESSLPTFVYPEHSVAMISSLRIGVITAIGYGVVQYAGYAAAGGILRAIENGTTPGVTNIATSSTSYVLYWFGASVVVFSYLFNVMLRQGKSENRTAAHYRASGATALAIAALIAAFYTSGIKDFSSGLYVTGVIVTGDNYATYSGDPVNPWASWVFIALLASTAMGALLYLVFGFLHSTVLERVTGVRQRINSKNQLNVNY